MGPRHLGPPPEPKKRRGLAVLVVVALLVVGIGGGAAVVLARDGGDQGGGTAIARTPMDAVTMFYEALRRGDCTKVDELSTAMLQEEVRQSGRGCTWLAEARAGRSTAPAAAGAGTEGDETSTPSVSLPEVAGVQIRLEHPDVAVVDTTFDLPADQDDVTTRRLLVSQPDGRWLLATGVQAHRASPGRVAGLDADVVLFLDRSMTDQQRILLEDSFGARDEIVAFDHLDQQESEAEFRRLFADDPDMLARVDQNPDLLPTSYRLLLTVPDQPTLDGLTATYAPLPGILRVVPIRTGTPT